MENTGKKGFAIAIDGPVGVGKSTTAQLVARELNMTYIDTGAMYRAVALYQLENGLDPHNSQELEGSLAQIKIDMDNENGVQRVFLNGRDVSALIRTQEVAQAASVVAVNMKVREKLVNQQREIAAARSVVMDGRDIGSHVLPHAQVKIYLDASIETRATRRTKELLAKNQPADYQTIYEETKMRDERDKTRELNPLVRAADAVYIDTGEMTALEAVGVIVGICRGA
ncbi:MAG: (d)CMP kinase [Defluviitaleaceae bacterium]|nr:(d)CMP kinase [Defluviitaleaceae bacterium]